MLSVYLIKFVDAVILRDGFAISRSVVEFAIHEMADLRESRSELGLASTIRASSRDGCNNKSERRNKVNSFMLS